MSDIDIKPLLYRIGTEVVKIAKDKAPYVSGELSKDIQIIGDVTDVVEIGNTQTASYAKFVHDGTGLYGKKKKKITPKKGKALTTPWGYRRSTKGQKAQPYLTDALSEYQSSGLDRALKSFAEETGEDIFKNIKKGFDK